MPEDPGANRVLVVDDDLSQRMMIVRILQKGDYECVSAMSTEEARALLDESPFGLVITDLRMFAEDGIELVRFVADHHPNTYSIVLSGFIEADDMDRVRRAGAFDLMKKPVDRQEILAMVEKAFVHRAQNAAERRHRSG